MTKTPGAASDLATFLADGRGMAMLIYALLFFMVMTMGATGVLALILTTFADSDKTPGWIKSHYQFQARTFWIGIAPTLILALVFVLGLFLPGIMAAMTAVGIPEEIARIAVTYIPFMAVLGWMAARCAMGFNHLFHNRAYPNPKAWLV